MTNVAALSGIPLKILHEAVGTQVYLEIESGESYSGRLTSVEDSMNVLLEDAKKTSKAGKVMPLAKVYVRGANVVFIQLPDALVTSPAVVAAAALAKLPKKVDGRGDGAGFGGARRAKRGRDE